MSGLQYVTGTPLTILKSSFGTATAGCPAGKSAIGGGFGTSVPAGSSAMPAFMQVDTSFYDMATMRWVVSATNAATGSGNRSLVLTAYAVCATVQ